MVVVLLARRGAAAAVGNAVSKILPRVHREVILAKGARGAATPVVVIGVAIEMSGAGH